MALRSRDLISGDRTSVRPVGSRPAAYQYGQWWSFWTRAEYQSWFGKVHGWSGHEVDTTPIGVLDAIIDRTKVEHEEREKREKREASRRKYQASMR